MSERIAILIVGMHRSGTSALARTVSLLGARLPNDLVAGNEGNPSGHWEPKAVVELNDRILVEAGSDVYGICEIASDWFLSSSAAQFVSEATRVLQASYEDATVIVMKDPRTALLLPIWHAALAHLSYRCVHILPLRHPSDVAESLRRRHLKTISYDAWAHPRGEIVWLRYTLASVFNTRGSARCFLNYADLLRNWRSAMSVAAKELDIVWPSFDSVAEREIDDFLDVEKFASPRDFIETSAQNPTELSLFSLATRLFDTLRIRGDDQPTVDALGAEFSRRLNGTHELIAMFEGLYPLIWRYYTATRSETSSQLEVGNHDTLREKVQQLWSNYTRVVAENRSLQQDLATSREQIQSLKMVQAQIGARQDVIRQPDRDDGRHIEISTKDNVRSNEAQTNFLTLQTPRRIVAKLRAFLKRFRA